MISVVFLAYALAQAVALIFALRLLKRDRHFSVALLCASAAGLVYDNAVLGLGSTIGAGSTLQSLNLGRFAIHAITTPLLAILGVTLARNAFVEWAWTRKTAIAYALIVGSAIAYTVYADVFRFKPELTRFADTLRYVNGASSGPPLAAITAMTLLIFLGISMFVKTKWHWLLTVSVLMFGVASFASNLGVVANLGEVALMAGLVATVQKFPTKTRAAFVASATALSPTMKEALAEQIRGRKRKVAVVNRWMAWIMFPILVIGTVAYYKNGLGLPNIANWISPVFNNTFILMFFVHAAASFYLYGIPKPKGNIRVIHVYIGYGVFLFTMISQSFRSEPLHLITYLINWVFIVAHLALSLRFMLKRVAHKRIDPLLDFAVGRRLSSGE
jgi:hypothetical protein